MKKSYVFLGLALLLSACGTSNQGATVIKQGNLKDKIYAGTTTRSGLKAQGVYVDSSTTVGNFMRVQISQDSMIQRSLRELNITVSAMDAIDWSSGVQKVDDQSDMYDDRYWVEVFVPLRINRKVIYHYKALYEGNGNVTGYITSIYARDVVRSSIRNNVRRTVYWNLASDDISAWTVTGNSTDLSSYKYYTTLSSNSWVVGEDLAVPTSLRSPVPSMLPADETNLSAQSIVVSPAPVTCDSISNSNGGVQSQSIIVCPVKPPTTPPPPSDPAYVYAPDCRVQEAEVAKAQNNYNQAKGAAGFALGAILYVASPGDIAAAAVAYAALGKAREEGINLKIARIKYDQCLHPRRTASWNPPYTFAVSVGFTQLLGS